MNQFKCVPTIQLYDTCKDFVQTFKLDSDDLIIVSEHTYHDFLQPLMLPSRYLFLRHYGQGEPTDLMVDAIGRDLEGTSFKRVIAIGGGTILDVAKLFALETMTPVGDLFDQCLPIKKSRELILIPTTCGTGSEVTNISILELTQKGTKKGLAVDALFPDYAVLIPELLKPLPFQFFATSAIDAMIHALESYLSPKATPFSQLFSLKALSLLLTGFQDLEAHGADARFDRMDQFLLASTYAGIAFGNAGCAAVHALSYPLGANYHIPHGEANYAILKGVIAMYEKKSPKGRLEELTAFLSHHLSCPSSEVYTSLDALLSYLLPRKPLKAYGMTPEEIALFTDSVLLNQTRLLANNHIPLSREEIVTIYQSLYDY